MHLLPSTLGIRFLKKGEVLQAVSEFPALSEWFVAFTDARQPVWWQKFLKKGYSHCWAFTYDPASDRWIVFEPTWKASYIRAIEPSKFAPFIYRASNGGPVFAVPVSNTRIKKARLFMTCVSEVCHIIGVDLFFATPWRLQCELTKMDCERKFEANFKEQPHGQSQSLQAAKTTSACI
jgi:hypothetical protein